ncbi:efflux RND transporter periplasmic adaptor subunit (plasmid) [Bradyrhizobium sp. PMVTL-01]|uniref:efflux RND transporter periplasmic adaptor subunit n=1 Tax=Bradyrhizobium sp. PMVTL-01 TaxID=3434999 RepID=UPI003F6F99BE
MQPADVSSLSFEIAGQLKAVTLIVGQKVQLGDVLAEIDPRSLQTQVEQAGAGVQQAQAQLDNAEADFQRKEDLLKNGVTTQAIFDQSRTALLTSRAQVDQAKRQLDLASHNLDRSKLLAPFSFTVARVDTKSFAQVAAGQPILTLYSDDRFEMSFLVPAPRFQNLKVGQHVGLKVADLPDVSMTGEIRELGSNEVTIEDLLTGGPAGFLVPISVLAPEGGKELKGPATVFAYDGKSSTVQSDRAERLDRCHSRQSAERIAPGLVCWTSPQSAALALPTL